MRPSCHILSWLDNDDASLRLALARSSWRFSARLAADDDDEEDDEDDDEEVDEVERGEGMGMPPACIHG